jgi:predicted nuclease with TOPRIM domain
LESEIWYFFGQVFLKYESGVYAFFKKKEESASTRFCHTAMSARDISIVATGGLKSTMSLQEQYQDAIATIRMQEEELFVFRTELERSAVSLTELNKENDTLANDIYDLIAENEELTEAFDNLYGVTKHFKQKNKTLKHKIEQMASQMEEEQHAADKDVQAGKQEDLRHKIIALSREKKDLEEMVKHVVDEKDGMHDTYSCLASDHILLTKDLADKDAIIIDLRRSLESGSNGYTHQIPAPPLRASQCSGIGSLSRLGSLGGAPPASTDATSVVSRGAATAENATRRITQASSTIMCSVRSMMQGSTAPLFPEGDSLDAGSDHIARSQSSFSLSDLNGTTTRSSQLFEDFNSSRNLDSTIDEASSCSKSSSKATADENIGNSCAFVGWDGKDSLDVGFVEKTRTRDFFSDQTTSLAKQSRARAAAA